MRIAIISDIHSNCFALEAVIKDIKKNDIDQLIILGDIFGYYPWAFETYQLLLPYLENAIVIKGNHDQLLLDTKPPNPIPSYWEAAKLNEKQLIQTCPEALTWLKQLDFSRTTDIENYTVGLYHGTPENPENGRFYPTDAATVFQWYPKVENSIILLGHSHYPLIFPQKYKDSFIVNPGSVGQSRDGNPMPSWIIWSTKENKFEIIRTKYENLKVIEKLKVRNWNTRAILALNKTQKGNLL